EAISTQPFERIEIIWNGEVQQRLPIKNDLIDNTYRASIDSTITAKGNGWAVVRCEARPTGGGGIPFAHTGPWHVRSAGPPLEPHRREVEYFLRRVEEEIERNRAILGKEQLADYYRARDFWSAKLNKLAASGN